LTLPDDPTTVPAKPGRRVTFPRPQVKTNCLYPDGGQTNQPALCALDTPAWFAWLETATTFRYHSTCTRPVARGFTRPLQPISLRKEQRRRGFLWYAYLRKGGQLLKRYAGRPQALTITRLDEIALDLNFG
jgi:hypothetical protein